MKEGKTVSTYIGIVTYNPFNPNKPRIVGKYENEKDAEEDLPRYGGFVVSVTETLEWKPIDHG